MESLPTEDNHSKNSNVIKIFNPQYQAYPYAQNQDQHMRP